MKQFADLRRSLHFRSLYCRSLSLGLLLLVQFWAAACGSGGTGEGPASPVPDSNSGMVLEVETATELRTIEDKEREMAEHGAQLPGEPRRKNRLADESSPYLLLHQYNPVDWYPWGEEALAKAKEEDKPIFLSVGYSTCYWCHVMERESFSDPEIAAFLNEHFVNIKVDREERPDLDEVYMTATQLITRQGGWPNSVFLTPELRPFFAGTYFPPEDRYGRPGFGSLLKNIHEAWLQRRGEIEGSAERIVASMEQYLQSRASAASAPPPGNVAERAFQGLARRFDSVAGGFGGAPKFPSPSNLFLLEEMAAADPRAGEMLTATLDAMARGGIYDQLAGGFHRYSTDAKWLVPHFEKMLYDNGFLLELYGAEYARTGDPEAGRIARETVAWLDREMTSEEGAYYSAIDAETEGEEGAFYVWTREELEAVLGAEAAFLAPVFGFAEAPFFEGDHYVLHLPEPLARRADSLEIGREELLERVRPLRRSLRQARAERERPLTDDKILADWNGMAIAGLAVAGRHLKDEEMVRRAERAAAFLLEKMRSEDGTLLHSWRKGEGKIPAYLSDYAFLVRGLLALDRAVAAASADIAASVDVGESGGSRWLEAASDLSREMIQRLRAPEGGYYVAAEAPDLLLRSKDVFDGAVPSPNAIAVLNLLELAQRTGEDVWREEAEAALKSFAEIVQRNPEGLRMMSIAARRYEAAYGSEATSATSTSSGESGPAAQALRVVTAGLTAEAASDGGWRPFRVRVEVDDGWHVNANPASDEFLIPTTVEGRDLELRDVRYPDGHAFRSAFAEEDIQVYDGTFEVTGQLLPESEGAHLLLRYQVCDENRCLAPVIRELEIP